MEEGDASAGSGGGSHSESAGLDREDLRQSFGEDLVAERVLEEALFAGNEAEYEAAFQRPGDEVAFPELDESVFVPHWTQTSHNSSIHDEFPGYGSQVVDDSYSHEARALIDAHDAAEEERRLRELYAEPEPPRPDLKADPLKAAAIFRRMYGEIFGDTAEGATAGDAAAIPNEAVIEDATPQASAGTAPLIEAPPGYSIGGHRPGGHGVARGAFRDISDYDASGFGSMEEFDDVPKHEVQPIAFRGLRWIRRNVGNLKVTVSLQRGTPPHPPRDRKPQS